MDVLVELEAYARSHEALKAGRGNTDDVLAFIEWFRALESEHQALQGRLAERKETQRQLDDAFPDGLPIGPDPKAPSV